MKNNHLVFEATACTKDALNSVEHIMHFIQKIIEITGLRVIRAPVIVRRENGLFGITGFVIGENMHVAVDTFPITNEFTLSILSYFPLDPSPIRASIMSHFAIESSSIKFSTIGAVHPETTECEEEDCFRLARKNWRGRNVCLQHYTLYFDAHGAVDHDDHF
jgi:S-adenosylmethionine/arginine decarboxylase-like enzyme